MTYKTIGNTSVAWQDDEPLIWTMSEEIGEVGQRQKREIFFNWTDLREIVDERLLLLLKDEVIDRRHSIALVSVRADSSSWRALFHGIKKYDCYDKKITQIDWPFLVALQTIHENISKTAVDVLRQFFQRNPDSEIFAKGLQVSDFPNAAKRGSVGTRINAILSSALTRSACVEVLARCNEAYSDGTIDIGHYSFVNLAFSVYVRPESYRQIRLGDLKHDPKTDKFGIWIYPVKQRVANPGKVYYDLTSTVGMLLLKQRLNVIEQFGHLIAEEDHQKLALFPAVSLNENKTGWSSMFANENFGLHNLSGVFSSHYFKPIRTVVRHSIHVSATALRHTIGTQMALHGCSARTIQAVLKHSNDKACRSYVDIAFHGLINDLSESMKPAFETHFPVIKLFRSKNDPVTSTGNALFSEDVTTGATIFQGECGKNIRCEHAPFTCYGCNKFIPCFDAEHEVNLKVVEKEIDDFRGAGQPYKVMVDRWTRLKYEIQMVIAACNLYKKQVL